MYASTSVLALAIATAAAKTIVINAGQSGFTFSPDSVTADVGDMLEFHFFGSLHTAVQSDFSNPCQQSSGGFDSGRISNQPDGSGNVFQVMVTNTDPIWFFCATPTHCQGGMSGVVNPPSSGDSLDSYKSAAAGTSSSSSGGTVQGGVVVPEGSSGSSSSSAAPPSSSQSESSRTSEAQSSSSAPPASTTSSPASTSAASESSSGSPSTTAPASSKSLLPVTNSTIISTSAAGISTSKAVVPATSSPATTPSFVPVSGGGSLLDAMAKVTELAILLGLGVMVAIY